VVAVRGRPLTDSIRAIRLARKAAVLTSPDVPPEAVGKALVAARAAVDMVAVCSRLGYPDESVTVVGLHELGHRELGSLLGGCPGRSGRPADRRVGRGRCRCQTPGLGATRQRLRPPGRAGDRGGGPGGGRSGSWRCRPPACCGTWAPGTGAWPSKPPYCVPASPPSPLRSATPRPCASPPTPPASGPTSGSSTPTPRRPAWGSPTPTGCSSVVAGSTSSTPLWPGCARAGGSWPPSPPPRPGHRRRRPTGESRPAIQPGRGQVSSDGSWRLAADDPVFLAWGPGSNPPR